MISIIQMNIYIKLGPWTAILERISKPYQRYWKLYVVFPSPRGEEGSLPFLNEHADETFHSTCQEFNSARWKSSGRKEPKWNRMRRGHRCLPKRRTLKIFHSSTKPIVSPLLSFSFPLLVMDTYELFPRVAEMNSRGEPKGFLSLSLCLPTKS